ncbi:hypothetical protein C4D60_Mb09t02520 [Musa balbisiana]|uniref:Uncharacterized protein n=1 Tax=Musa balbisiana TaxID=52838 RepID=A0A4S8IDI2_MUSBA|nr:hypothetical protein C4D60_Mb09t02520 [Musa balbisiana]
MQKLRKARWHALVGAEEAFFWEFEILSPAAELPSDYPRGTRSWQDLNSCPFRRPLRPRAGVCRHRRLQPVAEEGGGGEG